jgi:hypothetical protein
MPDLPTGPGQSQHRTDPTQYRSGFLFREVHGIFITGPPPRHPPIVAVEGFPLPGGRGLAAAEPLRGVRNRFPQPPAAAQPVPFQEHGGQGRTGIPAQPDLKLQDLHVHPAKPPGHPPACLPPVDPLEPSDRFGTHGPFPATAEHRRRYAVRARPYNHVFHPCKLWQGADNQDRRPKGSWPQGKEKPRRFRLQGRNGWVCRWVLPGSNR